MKRKQHCIGVVLNKINTMNRIDVLRNCSVKIRQLVEIDKEALFWLQVDLGCKFLELHFGLDAMMIATETNFWDLFIFEWYKDDEWLLEHIDLDGLDHYLSWKNTMLNEKGLCDLMVNFLERRHEISYEQAASLAT